MVNRRQISRSVIKELETVVSSVARNGDGQELYTVQSQQGRIKVLLRYGGNNVATFCAERHLLLDGLDAVPSALEALLPQADSVVTTTDGQDVAAQTPADTPNNSIKLELCALPARRARRIGICLARPDAYSSVLRGRSNVRLGEGGG